jgi:hypothetical protein
MNRMMQKVNDTIGKEFRFLPPHCLDLQEQESGIMAHIDNLNASGEVIATISLLSPCVLIFKLGDVEVRRELIEPLSLYIQAGPLRDNATHEIPMTDDPNHSIDGHFIIRKRRISIMIRDQPKIGTSSQSLPHVSSVGG